jgi:hypothetical protein
MSATSSESKSSIIDAVKTPLGFLVLGLLLVEGITASLAVAGKGNPLPLLWTSILLISLFAVLVVFLAWKRPEALYGTRPLQEIHADLFASNLFLGIDGALSNLEPAERAEAWVFAAGVIGSGGKQDANYSEFCAAVAAKVTMLANLPNRPLNRPGRIEP